MGLPPLPWGKGPGALRGGGAGGVALRLLAAPGFGRLPDAEAGTWESAGEGLGDRRTAGGRGRSRAGGASPLRGADDWAWGRPCDRPWSLRVGAMRRGARDTSAERGRGSERRARGCARSDWQLGDLGGGEARGVPHLRGLSQGCVIP